MTYMKGNDKRNFFATRPLRDVGAADAGVTMPWRVGCYIGRAKKNRPRARRLPEDLAHEVEAAIVAPLHRPEGAYAASLKRTHERMEAGC